VLIAIGLVLLSILWALRASPSKPDVRDPSAGLLSPEKIPLVTGDEPLEEMFTRAGCAVCHTIPGISGANGQVGPKLVLGTTGHQRLHAPDYRGHAQTVHEYIVESVLEPERFIVQGYSGKTMPSWYGSKLSALALEKIVSYLEVQMEDAEIR
jgi:Cytochrome c